MRSWNACLVKFRGLCLDYHNLDETFTPARLCQACRRTTFRERASARLFPSHSHSLFEFRISAFTLPGAEDRNMRHSK